MWGGDCIQLSREPNHLVQEDREREAQNKKFNIDCASGWGVFLHIETTDHG